MSNLKKQGDLFWMLTHPQRKFLTRFCCFQIVCSWQHSAAIDGGGGEQDTLTRHIFSNLHALIPMSHVTLAQGVLCARHPCIISMLLLSWHSSTLHLALFTVSLIFLCIPLIFFIFQYFREWEVRHFGREQTILSQLKQCTARAHDAINICGKQGDLDSWSQNDIVGNAFLTLVFKKSVRPCSQNGCEISNDLRQISCFSELNDDGNTFTTKHHHFPPCSWCCSDSLYLVFAIVSWFISHLLGICSTHWFQKFWCGVVFRPWKSSKNHRCLPTSDVASVMGTRNPNTSAPRVLILPERQVDRVTGKPPATEDICVVHCIDTTHRSGHHAEDTHPNQRWNIRAQMRSNFFWADVANRFSMAAKLSRGGAIADTSTSDLSIDDTLAAIPMEARCDNSGKYLVVGDLIPNLTGRELQLAVWEDVPTCEGKGSLCWGDTEASFFPKRHGPWDPSNTLDMWRRDRLVPHARPTERLRWFLDGVLLPPSWSTVGCSRKCDVWDLLRLSRVCVVACDAVSSWASEIQEAASLYNRQGVRLRQCPHRRSMRTWSTSRILRSMRILIDVVEVTPPDETATCAQDLGFSLQRRFKAIAEVVPGRPREKEEDRRAKGARSHGSKQCSVSFFFVVLVVLHLHVVASPSGKVWRSQARNNRIRWTGEDAKKTVKAVDSWRRQEAETAPSVWPSQWSWPSRHNTQPHGDRAWPGSGRRRRKKRTTRTRTRMRCRRSAWWTKPEASLPRLWAWLGSRRWSLLLWSSAWRQCIGSSTARICVQVLLVVVECVSLALVMESGAPAPVVEYIDKVVDAIMEVSQEKTLDCPRKRFIGKVADNNGKTTVDNRGGPYFWQEGRCSKTWLPDAGEEMTDTRVSIFGGCVRWYRARLGRVVTKEEELGVPVIDKESERPAWAENWLVGTALRSYVLERAVDQAQSQDQRADGAADGREGRLGFLDQCDELSRKVHAKIQERQVMMDVFEQAMYGRIQQLLERCPFSPTGQMRVSSS